MSKRLHIIIYRDSDDNLLASFDGGSTQVSLTIDGASVDRFAVVGDEGYDVWEVWSSE